MRSRAVIKPIVPWLIASCLLHALLFTGCAAPRAMSSKVVLADHPTFDFRDHLSFGSIVEFATADQSHRSGVIDEVHADAFQIEGRWYTDEDVLWFSRSDVVVKPPGPKILVSGEQIDFRDYLEFGSNIELGTSTGETREGLVDAVRHDAFLVDGEWYSASDVDWFRESHKRDYTDIILVGVTTSGIVLGLLILTWASLANLGS